MARHDTGTISIPRLPNRVQSEPSSFLSPAEMRRGGTAALHGVTLAGTLLAFFVPLLVSGQKGSDVLAGHRVVRVSTKISKVKGIYQDRKGQYWIKTWTELALYDQSLTMQREFSFITHFFDCFFGESPDGHLWLGTTSPWRNLALRYFDGEALRNPSPHLLDSIGITSKDMILAVFNSKTGDLCLAVNNRIVSYDGNQWRELLRLPPKEFGSARILSALQDDDGEYWLGLSLGWGVVRFNERNSTLEPYPVPSRLTGIRRSYEGRDGRLWFVDERQDLWVHDRRKRTWNTHDLSTHIQPRPELDDSYGGVASIGWIRAIYEDRARRLMVGTTKGLVLLHQDEQKWQLLDSSNSILPGDRVETIYEDRNGRIWIATSQGIIVLEQ